MSDPLLIALFEAAVRAARGEDLLVAIRRVSSGAWRYFGPGGPIDVAFRCPAETKCSSQAQARRPRRSREASKQCSATDRSGIVLVKHGHGHRLRRIAVVEGGHPVPDAAVSPVRGV